MPRAHQGYLARNKHVASIYGLEAGLRKIQQRIYKRKDCPTWILIELDNMIQKTIFLARPLVEHRDELPQFLKD